MAIYLTAGERLRFKIIINNKINYGVCKCVCEIYRDSVGKYLAEERVVD